MPAPIPVQVAIVQSWQRFSRDAGDQAVDLSRQLEQSGLFEAVHYPLPTTAQLGATMQLNVESTFQRPDLGIFGLPASLLSLFTFKLRCHCLVDGKMFLLKGDELIKTYSARGEAVLKFRGATTPKGELEVTQAAARVMQARLIEQLIQDRELLAQKLKGSP